MTLQESAAKSLEHFRLAGDQAWQSPLTNGLLWDLSLYFAASPMSPKNAKPPAR